uniref:Flavin-containing monooxygenase n=1 Tax=Pinguiococcus pyrenoidosus TaxID=172671 RepID=A0A6U0UMI3_9STRA
MYRDLVSNLPKEVMCFNPEEPFPSDFNSYVTHAQVHTYLQSYAEKHQISDLIRFDCQVSRVQRLHNGWKVFAKDAEQGEAEMGDFDGVFVCSGHFDKPSLPMLPGLQRLVDEVGVETKEIRAKDGRLPLLVHSRAYDSPEIFANKRVLVIGARASGTDVGREIATQAQEVSIVDKAREASERKTDVVTVRPLITSATVQENTSVLLAFADGSSTEVDCVVFATGYDYDYDFVDEDDVPLETEDRRVFPLYLQLFHADYPSLMFLGIPHSVVPFPLFDLQARLGVKYLLEGEGSGLPPPAKMREEIDRIDQERRAAGKRDKDAHYMGDKQWRYDMELLKLIRMSREGRVEWQPEDRPFLEWLHIARQMYEDGGKRRANWPGAPDDYRRLEYRIVGRTWHVFSADGELLTTGEGLDPDIGLDEAVEIIARLEDDAQPVVEDSAVAK